MNSLQHLKQNVLQKYGWSAKFDTDQQGCWCAEVTVGICDTRRYTSGERSDPESDAGRKQGQRAVSQVALDGLSAEIQKMESLPVKTLAEVFPNPIDVYNSNSENWRWFWDHKPRIVGIDVEGNLKAPPVLVQISVDEYTILEAPRKTISTHLRRLLADESVIKVFCDNNSHKDKKSLGLDVRDYKDFINGHIVDLEALAARCLGPVSACRGVCRIVSLLMPELECLVRKPTTKSKGRLKNIGRFALIEQGKRPPLKGIQDLSQHEQQYAALDSWVTLQAYKRLVAAPARPVSQS